MEMYKNEGSHSRLENLELKLHYPGGAFPSFSPSATAPVCMDCVTRWGFEELQERKQVWVREHSGGRPCGKKNHHLLWDRKTAESYHKARGLSKKAKMWQEKTFGQNHLDNIAMYETDVRILDKGFSLSYHPPPLS